MFQQVIMKRVKMMLFQVFFHNVVENIQNFNNEWEENVEYSDGGHTIWLHR